MKLLNHKSSSSDPDRVTAVVPLWPVDLSDDNVWTRPMGKDGSGELGLRIWVEGREYAGCVAADLLQWTAQLLH